MILWTLHYSQDVIRYLYQLREKGSLVRGAVQSLKSEPVLEGSEASKSIPNRFVLIIDEYFVVYELDHANHRIHVLSVGVE
ncbi:MAG: hypothetical protein AAF639_13720 [Chloroflexota bacterium]